jgi:copper transport protein
MLASAQAAPALAARPPVRFHATLLRSEPAKGSTLATPPGRIYLVFSEEIEPSLGGIRLVGPGGRIVVLEPKGDPRNVSALVAPVTTTLDGGTWRVEWRIVSEDGHPIDGDFTFVVRRSPSVSGAVPPPSSDPEAADTLRTPMPDHARMSDHGATSGHDESAMSQVPPLPAAIRGLSVGLLTALVGLLWFLGTRRDDAPQPRAQRLVARISIAMVVLFILHFVAWTAAVSPDGALGADHMAAMMSSRVGRMEVARDALAVLACWALVLARRQWLAFAFAVGAILVSSATGHSAVIHPAWTIPARALHLFAVAAWLGGLLWLLTLERSSIELVAAEAERVSSLALIGVIVVTITGVVQTKFFIGEWGELVRSAYGALALVKLAGLAGLVLFGAHHRFRVMPRLTEAGVADRFSRSLRSEVVLLSLVILVGGLLAYVPPPRH